MLAAKLSSSLRGIAPAARLLRGGHCSAPAPLLRLAPASQWLPRSCRPAQHSTHSASASPDKLRVCVVGSGPAGMYTAEKLVRKHGDNAEVTIVDRLPTPFGLVRSGVAPDHQSTKNVTNQFGTCLADPRVQFLGNVEVGRDVSVEELRAQYHAVVLAYGAYGDRSMGVPGEGLPNSLSAREFVFWFNGHPDYAHLPVDLTSSDTAVIFGQGNVAVDCARVLLQDPDVLASSDIAEGALAVLRRSTIRRVLLVGRRGPVQGAYQPKELREILSMEGVALHVRGRDLEPSEADVAEMKAARAAKRKLDIITKAAVEASAGAGAGLGAGGRELHLRYYRSPFEVVAGPGGGVGAVRMERTELQPGRDGGPQRAVGTGDIEEVAAGLVLRSIGFKSEPVPGVPFDAARAVVPAALARVTSGPDAGAAVVPGLYVAGWVRRGPTGIIGSNLHDAEEAALSITEDFAAGALPAPGGGGGGYEGLASLLATRRVRAVTSEGWRAIDAAEVAAGQAAGKPREKAVTYDDMLKIAGV